MTWTKDPDAVLDYGFDWSAWLSEGEAITSSSVTVEGDLVVESKTESGGVVTVWLSGGAVGDQRVACRITTNQGRTDERTERVSVKHR